MTLGPSMNHGRYNFGCGMYHSSVNSGRPVIVAAGSMFKPGSKSTETWDFTVPGSQWQLSKYVVKRKTKKTLSLKSCAMEDKYHNFMSILENVKNFE